MAAEQQTRDRLLTPNRGAILDRNMVGIAKTETVSSVSVIYNRLGDREETARVLSRLLEMDYDEVLTKLNRRVALERIKTKVPKEIGDTIRELNLPGVIVDEDVRRVYPFSTLAAQVIGFVGRDNQGIIGLDAKYDAFLQGERGKILTETDIRGREIPGGRETRVEPRPGYNLVTSIDVTLQQYAEQTIAKALEATGAKRGTIILMNPQNGEIYAMANKPDFDLNDPFTINSPELSAMWEVLSEQERNDALNQMWRNFSINDTYEPGSTFKIFTSVAGFEENVVTPQDQFVCTGSHLVGDRAIRCWRSPRSHGTQTFVEGVRNSCNPVFMIVAERLGADIFYQYLDRFGFNRKTGIDLPGEATGIMHRLENVGPVELATMSFGQSFQITPLQLISSSAAVINGGRSVTPHFALKLTDEAGDVIQTFTHGESRQILSPAASDTMREILEEVVYAGTGNRTYLPGYRVGGKTATSEKLPRRSGKYIASFMAFAPAEDPAVIALVLIDEPQGMYYGGMVAGPVMRELLANTLPYLGIEPLYNEEELRLPETMTVVVPDFTELMLRDAARIGREMGLKPVTDGEGDMVRRQFPQPGDVVNKGAQVIFYLTPSEAGQE
jgi:stage V sporulation protein D (sporulation-specific penicillin-binding protein)